MWHIVFFTLGVLMMFLLPFLLAYFLFRRRRMDWGLFAIGAVTFVLSQVGHIPFNAAILPKLPALQQPENLIWLGLFLGLSAGLFEETARWLTFRFWAKNARHWQEGMMVGLGHGGIESILVGLIAAINGGLIFAANIDPILLQTFPADVQNALNVQATLLFSRPPYELLAGGLERLFAITFHLSASLLVMQCFIRRQWFWLPLAIGLHTLFNFVAVMAAGNIENPMLVEGLIGLLALFSLVIILWLRQPDPVPPTLDPLPDLPPVILSSVEPSSEKLDASQFTQS